MMTIEQEIDRALHNIQLPHNAFVKADAETARLIVSKARDIFVADTPRSWWLSLKTPKVVHSYPNGDAPQYLLGFIPPEEKRCWFIPEMNQMFPPVYDAVKYYIQPMIEECYFFEYNLVGKDFNWLIVENDHNELIVSDIRK